VGDYFRKCYCGRWFAATRGPSPQMCGLCVAAMRKSLTFPLTEPQPSVTLVAVG